MTRDEMLRLRLDEGLRDAEIARRANCTRQWMQAQLKPLAPKPEMVSLRVQKHAHLTLLKVAEPLGQPVLDVLQDVLHQALLAARERDAVEAMQGDVGVSDTDTLFYIDTGNYPEATIIECDSVTSLMGARCRSLVTCGCHA